MSDNLVTNKKKIQPFHKVFCVCLFSFLDPSLSKGEVISFPLALSFCADPLSTLDSRLSTLDSRFSTIDQHYTAPHYLSVRVRVSPTLHIPHSQCSRPQRRETRIGILSCCHTKIFFCNEQVIETTTVAEARRHLYANQNFKNELSEAPFRLASQEQGGWGGADAAGCRV